MQFEVTQVQSSDDKFQYLITRSKVGANNLKWTITKHKLNDKTLGWYVGDDDKWHCVVGSTKTKQFDHLAVAELYLKKMLPLL